MLLRIPVLLYSVYVLNYGDFVVAINHLHTNPKLWEELNEIFSNVDFPDLVRMIWQFEKEPSDPLPNKIIEVARSLDKVYSKLNYEDFEKDACYLIVYRTAGSGRHEDDFLITYYVGSNTSTKRKKAAIEFGIKMYSILSEYSEINVQFARELIGYETPIFQKILEYFSNPESAPTSSLYLVKGDETSATIVKIPLSLGWMNDDENYCLVLEFNYKSYEKRPHVYCSINTTELEKEAAKKLGVELLAHSYYYEFFKIIYFETGNIMRENLFWERLGKWELYAKVHKPSEDDIRQQALMINDAYVKNHNEAVTLYWINGTELEKIQTGPLTFDLLQSDKCYAVDSASFGGWYVVLGKQTSLQSKIEAVQCVENTFDPNFRKQVTITVEGKDLVELKINFIGWSHNKNVKLDPDTQKYHPDAIEYQ